MSATPSAPAAALNVIPAPFQSKAHRALATTFPQSAVVSVSPVYGGLSGSLVYKVQLPERAVLLRIISHASPMNDPVRQFACMHVAASCHVAPPVYFTDPASGVSISAFVDTSLAPPTPRDMAQLGALLRQLHTAPDFPESQTSFELIRGGVSLLEQRNVVLPQQSRDVLAEFGDVARILEPHIVLAPSHNDINPGNVLRDGERQWLVDWDSGCMNDPMFDLACATLWFLLDADREATLLTSYFGRVPGAQDYAKLTLMKHVVYCYYMLVFQLISLGPDGLGDLDAIAAGDLPPFDEFMSAVGRRELSLQQPDVRRQLSMVLAKLARASMQQPGYLDAKRALTTHPNQTMQPGSV